MSKVKQLERRSYSMKPQESTQASLFSQSSTSSSQIAKQILESVEAKVIQKLKDEQITISLTQIPFLSEPLAKQKQQLKALQRIQRQKNETKQKLLTLEQTFSKLSSQVFSRSGLAPILQRSTPRKQTSFRSQFSHEDFQKIRKIQQQNLLHQSRIKMKDLILKENQEKYRKQQEEYMQKLRHEKSEGKKKEIMKRLKMLEQNKKQREIKLIEDHKRMAEIRAKKRLYSVLQTDWQKKQAQKQLQNMKLLQQRKREKTLDFLALKQHEKKYQELIRKNRQDTYHKKIQARKINHVLFQSRARQTKFHEILYEQQQKRKQQQQEKREFAEKLLQKKKKFSELVKLNYVPKPRTKSEQHSISQSQASSLSKTRSPLCPLQARKAGLKFLNEAKSKANKNNSKEKETSMQKIDQKNNPNSQQKNKNSELKQSSFTLSHVGISEPSSEKKNKYHDYLKEIRMQRQKTQRQNLKLQKGYSRQVEQAKRIMQFSQINKVEKIERVKVIAERLENDYKYSNSSSILKKIQAKMQILEILS